MNEAWTTAIEAAYGLPSGVTPPPPKDQRGEELRVASAKALPTLSEHYEPPSRPPPPKDSGAPLIVTDQFNLSMIDMTVAESLQFGARILVRQITKLDAKDLVDANRPTIMCAAERNLSTLERELGLESIPRPVLTYGTRFLVMNAQNWKDVRFYLVEYESDGAGCVP